MCYKQLILITLAIISIALSLKVFYKINNKKKNGKEYNKIYGDGVSDISIEGTWTNSNQILLVDNSDRSLYQNQSFFDQGHYFSSISQIQFQKQGLQNISYNSNSLIITETFNRNESNTACLDDVTKNGENCGESATNGLLSCQDACGDSGPICMSGCDSTYRSAFSKCTNDMTSNCYNCNGNFIKDNSSVFGIGTCNGIKSNGTLIGNWASKINNGQTISIRDNNTVLYTMFSGTTDAGTYDKNSSKLILSTQGVKNISYDSSTDTITVSVNMTKAPNNPINTLNSKIFTSWGSNDDLHINYDGTVTAVYLSLNGQIFDVYDSSNFKVEYEGQTYKTYRYDPSSNTITDIEDNRVFSRFRPV